MNLLELTPLPNGLATESISCGSDFICAVGSDGSIYQASLNSNLVTLFNNEGSNSNPWRKVIDSNQKFSTVKCGYAFATAY